MIHKSQQQPISIFKAAPAVLVMFAFLVNNFVFHPDFKNSLCKTGISSSYTFCVCPAERFLRKNIAKEQPLADIISSESREGIQRSFTTFFFQGSEEFSSDRVLCSSEISSRLFNHQIIYIAPDEQNISWIKLFTAHLNKAPPAA